jgi:hypothetical protein
VGLLLDTATAVIASLKRRGEELAASALLHEALRTLNSVAAEHWKGGSISEVPEMIRELARDRDDFKAMADAYREDLARAEVELRAHKHAQANACNCAYEHEKWCNAYAEWRKEIDG